MTEANLATALKPTKRQKPLTPDDIVRDRNMSIEDKRARLASWASDARAVPNCPALRRLDDGNLVLIDEVLSALKVLDGQQVESARPSNEHTTRLAVDTGPGWLGSGAETATMTMMTARRPLRPRCGHSLPCRVEI